MLLEGLAYPLKLIYM